MKPKGYIICFVPRSGSTWLSQMLASTRLLGEPREYFHEKQLLQYSSRFPTLKEYCNYLKSQYTVNNVFGMKVTWTHMQALLMDGHTPNELFDIDFKYIWLDRKDTIMQGISEYRAMSTQCFHSKEESPVHQELEYNKQRILEVMSQLAWERTSFQIWLKRNKKCHAQINYEDIVANPGMVVKLFAVLTDTYIPPLTKIGFANQQMHNTIDYEWKNRILCQ